MTTAIITVKGIRHDLEARLASRVLLTVRLDLSEDDRP